MSPHRLVVDRPLAMAVAMAIGLAGLPMSGMAAPPTNSDAPGESAPEQDGTSAPADGPRSDSERARELAQEGRGLYWKGEYRAAIEAFSAAHALHADPNLLFNISAAHEKLEQYEQALDYLDRYAPDAPPEETEAIRAKRAELQAKLEAAAEPEPEPEPGAEPTPAPIPEPTPDPGSNKAPIMGAAGWTLVGIAAAGIGLGTGFGVSALLHSRSGQDGCTGSGGTLRCSESARGDLDTAHRHAIVADVSLGVAVVAAAAALTVLGVRLSRRKRAGGPDVALHGLGATVRF